MKKLQHILVLTILVIAPLATEARPKGEAVAVLSKKRDIFYFKVNKAFCGASIEVYSPDGTLILTDKVTHHKALIDFYYENPGHYTIKIRKDDKTQEFSYDKATPSPFQQIDTSYHVSLNQ